MRLHTLKIGDIKLQWSEWYGWEALKIDGRTKAGIKIPNGCPGVYELRYKNRKTRLTIGKASNLRFRIRQALIKNKGKHSSGTKIRSNVDVRKLVIRWSETYRTAASEEALHKLYSLK